MAFTPYLSSIFCNTNEQSIPRPKTWNTAPAPFSHSIRDKFSWVKTPSIFNETSFVALHQPKIGGDIFYYTSILPLGVQTYQEDNTAYWNNCARLALCWINYYRNTKQQCLLNLTAINEKLPYSSNEMKSRLRIASKGIRKWKEHFHWYRLCAKTSFGLITPNALPKEVSLRRANFVATHIFISHQKSECYFYCQHMHSYLSEASVAFIRNRKNNSDILLLPQTTTVYENWHYIAIALLVEKTVKYSCNELIEHKTVSALFCRLFYSSESSNSKINLLRPLERYARKYLKPNIFQRFANMANQPI